MLSNLKITPAIKSCVILLIWLFSSPLFAAATAPFECDGRFYQSIRNNNVNYLYEVETSPVNFKLITNLTAQGIPFGNANALAYNPVDNLLYMSAKTNTGDGEGNVLRVFKLDRNGNTEEVGVPKVSGVAISESVNSGVMSFSGLYFVSAGSSKNMYAINLSTMAANNLGTYTGSIPDMAIHPITGEIYGWNQTGRILSRIDLDSLTNPTAITATTNIGSGNSQYGTMGAAYFTAAGDLIVYGDDRDNTAGGQETLATVNTSTGVITKLGVSEIAATNDGASCPYYVTIKKNISAGVVTLGSIITYTFEITNASTSVLPNLAFSDVLVDGYLWNSEPKNLSAGLVISSSSITGNAVGAFNIDSLPAGVSTFDIDVLVPNAVTSAEYSNIAYLNNLPVALGSSAASDDGNTSALGDATKFTIGIPELTLQQSVAFAAGGDVDSSGTFTANDVLEYTITLTNNGTVAVNATTVSNIIPATLNYVASSISGANSRSDTDPAGAGLSWNITSVAGGGAQATMSYQASIQSGVIGVINVQAEATGINISGSLLSDAANVSTLQTVTLINDADASSGFSIGDTVQFNIALSNNGTISADDLQMNSVMSSQLNYIAASIAGADRRDDSDPSNQSAGVPSGLVWNINSLSIGGGNTQTLTYQATIGSSVDTTAGVVSSATLLGLSQNSFVDMAERTPVLVTTPPVMSLTKTVTSQIDADGSGSITPGDTLRYTLVLSASGSEANGLTIFDAVPQGFSYVLGSISTAISNSENVTDAANLIPGTPLGLTWGIDTLAAGSSATLTFDVTVDSIGGAILPNQAYAMGNFVGFLPSDDPAIGGTVDATLLTVDDLPTAVDDFVLTTAGINLTINALINDTDLGDGLASITLPSATSARGAGIVITDPSTPDDPTDDLISYTTPVTTGADSFNYVITDIDGDTSTGTVFVSVDSPNIQLSTQLDASLVITGLVTDTDTSTNISETDVLRLVTTVTNGVGGISATSLTLQDILPAGYGGLTNVSIVSTGTVGIITDNSSASQLNIDIASLAAESSVQVSYDVSVAGSTAGTFVNNSPQIAGANFVTVADMLATYINPLPPSTDYDVSVALSDGQTSYTPGVQIIYTLTVANAGPATSDPLALTLAEPVNTSIFSWTCVASGGATCSNASGAGAISELNGGLPSGGTLSYSVNLHPVASRTGDLALVSSITTGANDTNAANNSVTDTDTALVSADISVSLDDGLTAYTPGNNVNYTLQVTNTGPSDAQGVNISYAAAAGSSVSAWSCTASGGASCPGASGSGNLNQNYSGGFPAGAGLSYAITLAVASSRTGDLVTTASASSTTNDPDNTDNSATQTETQSSLADVTLMITDGVSTYAPGSSVLYTFNMSNVGPSDGADPRFVFSAPAGSNITGWTCSASGGMVCPNTSGIGNIDESGIGPFISGSSAVFVVTLATDSNRSGDLVASGALTTASTDPNLANNTPSDTNSVNLSSDYSITIDDAAGSYTPGGSTVYSVTVSNNGPSDSSGASFTMTTPGIVANSQSWTCSGNGCSAASGSGDIAATLGTMASGQSAIYSVSLTIDGAQSGNLLATAAVSLAADANAANDSATDTDSINSSSDISVTLNDATTSYVPGSGETKTYTLSVINNGPSSASNISVSMTAPGSNTIGNWSCTNCGGNSGSGNIADSIASLASGVTAVYTVPMTLDVATTGDLVVTASASITGDSNTANNSATDTDVESTSADVGITLSDASSTYIPGLTSVYTLLMTNNGPSAASNSVLTMSAPAGSSISSWTCTGVACPAASGSGNISQTVLALASAASVTYSVSLSVNANTSGDLISTASVSSGSSDPQLTNNSVSDTNTQLASADVRLTISDNTSSYVPGETKVYTVTVFNDGPSDVINTPVTMVKPGIAANTINWSCSNCGGGSGSTDINHNLSSLAAGASAVYTITVGIDAAQTGDLVATALAIRDTGDSNLSNNMATDIDAIVANADLQMSLSNGQTLYVPGNNFSYTYTISNNGPNTAVNVTATFVPQAGTIISSWGCVASGGVVCPNPTGNGTESNQLITSFPAGGQVVYTINMNIPVSQTGNLSATGNISSTTVDLVPGNNSATDTDTESARSDLSLTLSDSDSNYQAGDVQTYALIISNAGPDAATDATIIMADPGFNSMNWVCAANGGASCPGVSGNGAINEVAAATDLPSAGSLVYTITANTTAMSGDIVATASVSISNGFDPVSANNSASDTNTQNTGAPVISLLNTGDSGDGRYNTLEAEAVVVSGSTANVSDAETVTVRFNDGSNPLVTVMATVASNSWTATVADISNLVQGNITVTADVSEGATPAVTASVMRIYQIDRDADGIPDSLEGENDRDQDGISNSLDVDADADGLPDFIEGNSTGLDTDNDKLDNRYDVNQTAGSDVNADGQDDNVVAPDTDLDNTPDYLDRDADNDGLPDVLESGVSGTDTDGDGIDDSFDVDQTGGTDADGNGIDDAVVATDTDSDSIANYRDLDSDDDGIPDRIENGSSGSDADDDGIDDAFDVDETGGADIDDDGVDDATGPPDTDGDGTPDYLDVDSDNDGILDATEGDAAGVDTDGDGIDDAYDIDQAGGPDVDGDGIKDDAVTDTDADGIPDYRDLDTDGDGILDATEGETNTDGIGEADYRDLDSDEDGIPDAVEGEADADGDSTPNYRDLDSDGDGLSDLIEGSIDTDGDGTPDYLDTSADEDNDGWPDIVEGIDDRDGDGVSDAFDPDADNDGIADRLENGSSGIDTDGDGIDDVFDVDATGGTDANGDGVDDNVLPLDTDGDGVADYLDMDSDNDGISDRIEASQPSVPDTLNLDSDNDGIDDLYDVDATGGSDANGDGFDDAFLPVDTDGDGIIDMLDSDSDNDYIPDNIEASLVVASGSDIDMDGIDDAFDPDQTGGTDSNNDLIDEAVVTVADVDGDGIPNFRDLDSDGDGIIDPLENGDFNNDGILDPYQVDPGIETALSGSGSINSWLLFALALLIFSLRRQRAAWLLLLLVSAQAQADGDCAVTLQGEFIPCWYAGGSLGLSTLKPNDNNSGWQVTDTSDTAFGLQLGYHFSNHWFGELEYADLGGAGLRNNNPNIAGTQEISYKVPSLYAGYLLMDASEKWNLFAKVGLSNISNKASSPLLPFEEQSSVQASFAGGGQWRFFHNWYARLTFTSYDKDANQLAINIGRYFGGKHAKHKKEPEPEPTAKEEKPAVIIAIKKEDCQIFNASIEGINFESRSARLTPFAREKLNAIVIILKQYPDFTFKINAHTDSSGSAAYNMELSKQRARSVAAYLVYHNIDKNHLTTFGYGESKPIASNETNAGRALNRRVEIVPENLKMCAGYSTTMD